MKIIAIWYEIMEVFILRSERYVATLTESIRCLDLSDNPITGRFYLPAGRRDGLISQMRAKPRQPDKKCAVLKMLLTA